MEIRHIEGTDKGSLLLYTLSTCVWCKKTKAFLNDLGIGYDYVEVDNLPGDDKGKAMEEVKRFNPECSFPSLVINNEQCVVGFDEARIREVLGI